MYFTMEASLFRPMGNAGILQGVAVGGEVPGAWVFVRKHVHLVRPLRLVGTRSRAIRRRPPREGAI